MINQWHVHSFNTGSSSASNFYRKYPRQDHHKNSFATSLYTDFVLFFFSLFSKTFPSTTLLRWWSINPPRFYFLSPALDGLRRENRGSVNRLLATVGAKLWNSIPENLWELSKHAFKKQIHNLLLLDRQRQDSYADINILINEIKKRIILSNVLWPLFFYLLTYLFIRIVPFKLFFPNVVNLSIFLCKMYQFKYVEYPHCLPRMAFLKAKRRQWVCLMIFSAI